MRSSKDFLKVSICSTHACESEQDKKTEICCEFAKKNEQQSQKSNIKKLTQKVNVMEEKLKRLAKCKTPKSIKMTPHNQYFIRQMEKSEKQQHDCINLLYEKRLKIFEEKHVYSPSQYQKKSKVVLSRSQQSEMLESVKQIDSLKDKKNAQKNKIIKTNYSEKRASTKQSAIKQEKSSQKEKARYYLDYILKNANNDTSEIFFHLEASLSHFLDLKLMSLIEKYSFKEKLVYLKQKNIYKNKKTIIFDLDETLIHSFSEKQKPNYPKCEVIKASSTSFNVRPFVKQTLKSLSPDFQLIIFTASEARYANPIIDAIDPENLIQHRLFRDSCIRSKNGMFLKDLRIINRRFEDMVLIDNSAFSFFLQPQNGIPILPFFYDTADIELKNLENYLRQLSKVPDVREINKQKFHLHQYSEYTDVKKLIKDLYFKQSDKYQ